MKKKEIIISILFTILISLLMYFLSSKKSEDLIPVDVYEVFVEGKSIGYLSNEEEFLKLVDDKQEAIKKSEDAKRIAAEIVEGAKSDVEAIKQKVLVAVEAEIANLNKNFDEMMKVELSRVKKDVVASILEELLNSDTINLSQDELVNIVLKKVA